MPELNFNLLSPSAELYSGPQVKLDPQAAYDTAQAQQQSNMLSQLYAKHYDPQTGGINYNSLIGEAAQNPLTARAIPKIMEGAQSQAQSMAEIEQKRAAAAKSESEVFKSNVDNAMKWSRSQLDNIKTPEEYLKWHEANHTNPYLAEFFRQNNISKEDRRSEINSLLSQEGGLQKLIDMSRQGLDNYLGVKPAETKQFQPTAIETEYALYQKDPRAYAAFRQAQKGETAGAGTVGTGGAPADLNKDEIWNPAKKRVEYVQGSAADTKQRQAHGTDYDGLNTTKTVTKDNVANVDALLKAGNAWATETNNGTKKLSDKASEDAKAFANLFPGSYTGYATQLYSGKTASLKAIYDKLQATAKGLGLGRIKATGSIGTITEREWPLLGNQVLSLSPKMQTKDVIAELNSIKDKFTNVETQAVDKYDTIWGDTQYYKGAGKDKTDNVRSQADAIISGGKK